MVETPQQPMEIFLMAAVFQGGLNTLYALHRAVGLQPGSVSQVIKRLEIQHFLVRSAGGKRRRRTISLTEAGEDVLKREWRNCLDPNREMESILRSATVALLMEDPGACLGFLLRCAAERERRQLLQEVSSGLFSPKSSAIELYGAMRAVYESRRWATEAQVLRQLGQYLVDVFKES